MRRMWARMHLVGLGCALAIGAMACNSKSGAETFVGSWIYAGAINPNCQGVAAVDLTGDAVTITATDSSHIKVDLAGYCTIAFDVDAFTASASGGQSCTFDIPTLGPTAIETRDGGYALATVGLRRFRVIRWLTDDPFPQAEIDLFEEPAPADTDSAARDWVAGAFGEVLELWHQLDERVPRDPPPVSDDPGRDVFEIAAAAPLGPLDAQRVLEAHGTAARSAVLHEYLGELADVLRARIAE